MDARFDLFAFPSDTASSGCRVLRASFFNNDADVALRAESDQILLGVMAGVTASFL